MDKLDDVLNSINSELLTDDVKLQFATVFEETVNEAIEAKTRELEESATKELSGLKEELVEKLSNYIDNFIDEFIAEHREKFEESWKVEKADIVLEQFDKLMKDFNMALQPEKIEEESKLKKDYNAAVDKISELKKELDKAEIKAKIYEVASDTFKTDLEKTSFIEGALLELDNLVKKDKELALEKIELAAKSLLLDKDLETSKREPIDEATNESDNRSTTLHESAIDQYLKFFD